MRALFSKKLLSIDIDLHCLVLGLRALFCKGFSIDVDVHYLVLGLRALFSIRFAGIV